MFIDQYTTQTQIYAIVPDSVGFRTLPNGNKVKIGKNVKIRGRVKLGDVVVIGDNVELSNGVELSFMAHLNDGVRLGPGVYIDRWAKISTNAVFEHSPIQIMGSRYLVYETGEEGQIGIGQHHYNAEEFKRIDHTATFSNSTGQLCQGSYRDHPIEINQLVSAVQNLMRLRDLRGDIK